MNPNFKNSILLCLVALTLSASGCKLWRKNSDWATAGPLDLPINNPVSVPFADRNLVMDQVSDELDNYFRLKNEQRIRLVDNVLTEGWINTYPQIGSSIIEPWRKDSTPGYEKLHGTFQTIRRVAKVRVIPTGQGYNIEVNVFKELEDLPQPEMSNIGGVLLRHDDTLDFYEQNPFAQPINRGWIPLGRDFSLEQKIVNNIYSRIQTACQK
jgi:hypothetical protein